MDAKLIMGVISLTLGVLIVAGLVSILHPFSTAREVAETAKVHADIAAFAYALKTYKDLNRFLPSTSQGLRALVIQPTDAPVPKRWYQMMERLPRDPWGKSYRYKQPGKHHPDGYDVYTTGGPRHKAAGNW